MEFKPKLNSMNSRTFYITLMNQIFELERKIGKIKEENSLDRNINKIRSLLSDAGFSYQDPIGEPYNDMRTDCDAQVLSGEEGRQKITETIKPLIRHSNEGFTTIIQKAVVIVEDISKNKE